MGPVRALNSRRPPARPWTALSLPASRAAGPRPAIACSTCTPCRAGQRGLLGHCSHAATPAQAGCLPAVASHTHACWCTASGNYRLQLPYAKSHNVSCLPQAGALRVCSGLRCLHAEHPLPAQHTMRERLANWVRLDGCTACRMPGAHTKPCSMQPTRKHQSASLQPAGIPLE